MAESGIGPPIDSTAIYHLERDGKILHTVHVVTSRIDQAMRVYLDGEELRAVSSEP